MPLPCLASIYTIVDAATYYSTPNDGDTIRLEAHAVVSPNPMYESLDVPTRNVYEEVHDFETKAVPSGNADAALYTYVPPTVSFALHTSFVRFYYRLWGDHWLTVFGLSVFTIPYVHA